MFFTFFLLCGIINSCFGMQPVALPDNNPFLQYSDIQPIPSAPCDNCVQNYDICELLKSKNIVSKDFKLNNSDNLQKKLGNAIDEKCIANERTELAAIYDELYYDNFRLLSQEKKNDLAKAYKAHLEKEKPSISLFVAECIQITLKDQSLVVLKAGSWNMSENLNNAFELIYSEVPEIVPLSVLTAGFSLLLPSLNISWIVPTYCFSKGLLVHSCVKPSFPCKCHHKENNTFKCAYRWIYIGVGLLFLIRTYFLPFFARK